jgi:hypothetical protein
MLFDKNTHSKSNTVNFITFPSKESKLLVMKEKIINGNTNNKMHLSVMLTLRKNALMSYEIYPPKRYVAIKSENSTRGNLNFFI